MKRFTLLLSFFFISTHLVYSQKVDSIRVEQAGDLIKVHYKILNSRADQVFRVSVLCSIDGGLKSQLNSLAGDFGDNVVGGRSDYMILWDVLKDVDELKSAEFFIKAELVKDLSNTQVSLAESNKLFQKQYLNLQFVTDFPGPKFGIRVGYMRGIGISGQVLYGKIPVSDEYKTITIFDTKKWYSVGLDLTVRIIKSKNFQMHLLGGYRNSDLRVYYAGPPSPQLWRQGMHGLESGTTFIIKKFVATVTYSHLDPKQLEKLQEKVVIASPYNFYNFAVGIKF